MPSAGGGHIHLFVQMTGSKAEHPTWRCQDNVNA